MRQCFPRRGFPEEPKAETKGCHARILTVTFEYRRAASLCGGAQHLCPQALGVLEEGGLAGRVGKLLAPLAPSSRRCGAGLGVPPLPTPELPRDRRQLRQHHLFDLKGHLFFSP